MKAVVVFAILTVSLMLLGCAAQGQQPPAQQPAGEKAGTAKPPVAQPQGQASPPAPAMEKNDSSEDIQKELDAQDAGVQESIDDLEQLQ